MAELDEFAQQGLEALQYAVAVELERKRLLGQYAVFWKDGKVVREIPAPPEDPALLQSPPRAC